MAWTIHGITWMYEWKWWKNANCLYALDSFKNFNWKILFFFQVLIKVLKILLSFWFQFQWNSLLVTHWSLNHHLSKMISFIYCQFVNDRTIVKGMFEFLTLSWNKNTCDSLSITFLMYNFFFNTTNGLYNLNWLIY